MAAALNQRSFIHWIHRETLKVLTHLQSNVWVHLYQRCSGDVCRWCSGSLSPTPEPFGPERTASFTSRCFLSFLCRTYACWYLPMETGDYKLLSLLNLWLPAPNCQTYCKHSKYKVTTVTLLTAQTHFTCQFYRKPHFSGNFWGVLSLRLLILELVKVKFIDFIWYISLISDTKQVSPKSFYITETYLTEP